MFSNRLGLICSLMAFLDTNPVGDWFDGVGDGINSFFDKLLLIAMVIGVILVILLVIWVIGNLSGGRR